MIEHECKYISFSSELKTLRPKRNLLRREYVNKAVCNKIVLK